MAVVVRIIGDDCGDLAIVFIVIGNIFSDKCNFKFINFYYFCRSDCGVVILVCYCYLIDIRIEFGDCVYSFIIVL